MKIKMLIIIVIITFNTSCLMAQFVDWKSQVVRFVTIGTTPNNPSSYNWYEEATKGQGVHINLTPTEIVKIILEQGNNMICFGFYIGEYSYSHLLIYIDVKVNHGNWINLYQGSAKSNHIWSNSANYFTSLGTHNLQVRYMVANSPTVYYREYNIKVVPQSEKLFYDQYGNTMRLWKGNSSNPYPVLLSPGFDAYNTKPEQYYRYAGSELFDCLLENGFDVYVLYYKFNPQDLRNNAAVYSSAINYISNTWNNSKNIIAAGISMGGVISRYALAKAEHIGNPLPVDKWISLDAPHQGAYISKELQDFLVDNTSTDFDKYATNNKAAKTLLMYNAYDPHPDGFNINTGDNKGVIHTSFYNELNKLNNDGYPLLTYNIGVSFSTNTTNPNTGKWLNIRAGIILNKDIYLEPFEKIPGSYLPLLNIDPSVVLPFWGLIWATLTITQYKNPAFIPHASSLDIVNGNSKFDKTIIPSFTGFHDVVPSELIPEILSELIIDELYLQNQTITSAKHYKASELISVGSNVTGDIPQGNFIIEPGVDVILQSGEMIALKPGFQSIAGSNTTAFIDPYFTCTLYPNKKLQINEEHENSCLSVISEYRTSYNTDADTFQSNENQLVSLTNYPNPFLYSTTIKYNIENSNTVTISIHDIRWNRLLFLENRQMQEAGIYEIELNGIDLPAGIYYCTLRTEKFTETIKMIKAE